MKDSGGSTVHLGLRLPRAVHEKLAMLAEQDHRSLNSQVITLIEQEQKRRAAQGREQEG